MNVLDLQLKKVYAQMDLSFDSRAYSWYRMDYQIFTPLTEGNMKYFIPAKLFDELFDMYGDSPLLVPNPYIDKILKSSSKKDENVLEQILKQSLYDLRYIIQSNAYLPYTRTGTITLSTYDPRLKDGNWIFNKYSGEIMYLKAVNSAQVISNSGISSGMTLSVDRCMLLSQLSDYMNVIMMPAPTTISVDWKNGISTLLSKWRVNKDILARLIYNRNGEGWSNKMNNR